MKKKIKDCTFKEFIKNKSVGEVAIEMYPLLAILRRYNRSTSYGDTFKEEQWQWLKRSLSNEFLEFEIEVDSNEEKD